MTKQLRKTWHTNKTQPESGNDIIIITFDHDIYEAYTAIDEYGLLYLIDGYDNDLWKDTKDNVALWQYKDKYFAKEFNKINELSTSNK